MLATSLYNTLYLTCYVALLLYLALFCSASTPAALFLFSPGNSQPSLLSLAGELLFLAEWGAFDRSAHKYDLDIREVSLYVITYENPYVVHAGERGQLSYVKLSTDIRRKAVSYVGVSVGLFEIFFAFFRVYPWQSSSRTKHQVHTPYTTCKIQWKRGFGSWCMRWAHAANASPKQQGMFSSRGEITQSETQQL